MRLSLSLALAALLLAPLPALAADKPAGFDLRSPAPAVCAANAKSALHVAQLACCKKNKGVCGCRAGKIVCCDNTASNEPGCACHGDEAIVE
ncbi:MAG: hypothetical protein LDL16_02535 [Thiobacillus sp.]|nr:hypothetical protein [Thiobacillus sp.]